MPRFNFTGRRKISQSHTLISVTGIGGIETFRAELSLESYRFPASAAVVVEVYRQLELARFPFGYVGQLIPPEQCRLSEFGTLTGVRFRVKVISTEPPRGRLLGVADRILPTESRQESLLRVPLLAVRSQDLGREIWRIDFSDEPLLLVNARVVPKKQLVQSAEFQSLVLPEILRSILNRIVLVDQIRTFEDSEEWSARWLRFACSLPGVSELPDEPDTESDVDWIDTAIGAFCRWRDADQQFTAFWKSRHEVETESPTEHPVTD